MRLKPLFFTLFFMSVFTMFCLLPVALKNVLGLSQGAFLLVIGSCAILNGTLAVLTIRIGRRHLRE